MSDELFTQQLTRHMRMYGRTITTTLTNIGYYSNDGTITWTPPNETESISVDYQRGQQYNEKGEIRLLDSSFRRDSRSGSYRIDRAAALLIAEEARILEQRKKDKEQEKINAAWRKRYRWAKDMNDRYNNSEMKSNITITTPYEKESTEYVVTITSQDPATIMAIVDYLADRFVVMEKIKKDDKKE